MAEKTPTLEARNAEFRTLCALTPLKDLEIPTVIRKKFEALGISGNAYETITDEQIEAVFDAFPHADILGILKEVTTKPSDQVETVESLRRKHSDTSDLVRRMSDQLGQVISPKQTLH